jgi:hypothetical protein
MTEQEWLSCTEPDPIWQFLKGKASARRVRLLAAACCRQFWPVYFRGLRRIAVEVVEGLGREAVAVAERFADGLAPSEELARVRGAITAARVEETGETPRSLHVQGHVVFWLLDWLVGSDQELFGIGPGFILGRGIEEWEQSQKAHFLRDIFGNPFRPVAINLACLTPTVVQQAQALYDARNLADLPILADALEDAGCTSQELLAHLRGPALHVLGCWALDLVLNKK